MPDAAYDLIRETVRRALGRLGDFKLYRLTTPITLDLTFKNYRPAEVLAYLPIVERTDAHSIRFVGEDITQVSKFLELVTTYHRPLTP